MIQPPINHRRLPYADIKKPRLKGEISRGLEYTRLGTGLEESPLREGSGSTSVLE
jgi:hypothetical protein